MVSGMEPSAFSLLHLGRVGGEEKRRELISRSARGKPPNTPTTIVVQPYYIHVNIARLQLRLESLHIRFNWEMGAKRLSNSRSISYCRDHRAYSEHVSRLACLRRCRLGALECYVFGKGTTPLKRF